MTDKPDNTVHFWSDFRKVNEVSEFDAYSMPPVVELTLSRGSARFKMIVNLLKQNSYKMVFNILCWCVL